MESPYLTFLHALQHDDIPMARQAMEDGAEFDSVRDGAVFSRARSVAMLEMLVDYGHIPSELWGMGACLYGNALMLKWLCEHGYKPSTSHYSLEPRIEMLELYHRYGLEGGYKQACTDGTCIVCKQRKVDEMNELWVMEHTEYENGIQWLPIEMVNDVSTLL